MLGPAELARTSPTSESGADPSCGLLNEYDAQPKPQINGRNQVLEPDRPVAVPRAAAARATATSPSGCTAWTPVGEINTGIDTR